MTPFDAIKSLCNKKDCSILGSNEWLDLGMSSYMLNRWVSMTNRHNAVMVNQFNNDKRLSTSRNVEEAFELLSQVTKPFRNFKYNKRPKREDGVIQRELSESEKKLGLSKREQDMYEEFLSDCEHN